MAIVRLQGTPAVESAQSTSLSLTFSSATTAGNLVAVAIAVRSAVSTPTITSVIDNLSQTYTAGPSHSQGTGMLVAIYYFENSASGVTSVTLTTGQTNTLAMWGWAFSGVGTITDGSAATGWNSSSTAATTGSLTTTYANDLILGALAWSSPDTISSLTGGFTSETLQTSNAPGVAASLQAGYLITSSAGSNTYAGTLAAAHVGSGAILALPAGSSSLAGNIAASSSIVATANTGSISAAITATSQVRPAALTYQGQIAVAGSITATAIFADTLGGGGVGGAAIRTLAATTSQTPNVVVISFENKPFQVPGAGWPKLSAVIGGNGLPAKYMWHTAYSDTGQPSAPNYGGFMFADSSLTPSDTTFYDYADPATTGGTTPAHASFFGRLTDAHIHWETYYEGVTLANFHTNTDSYTNKHSPVAFSHRFNSNVAFYTNSDGSKIADAGSAGTAFSLSGNVNTFTASHPFQNMLNSMKSSNPASFYWAGPALANQAHGISSGNYGAPWNGSVSPFTADADAFAAYMVQQIQATAWYKNHGNILLWWDEGGHSGPTGEQTNLILINEAGAKAKGGYGSSTLTLNHYGLVHDLLTAYGGAAIGKSSSQSGSIYSILDLNSGTTGSPTQLQFLSPPTAVVSGTAFSPVVQVSILDGNSNPTGSTAPVTLTISTGSGSLSGITMPVTASGGVASFPGLILTGTAGTFKLTASTTDAGITSVVSAGFSVMATTGTPTSLSITVQPPQSPQTATPGVAWTPAVAVQILDQFSAPSPTVAALDVSFGTNSTGATLGGTLTQTTSSTGLATFSGLSVNNVGTYTLVFGTANALTAEDASFEGGTIGGWTGTSCTLSNQKTSTTFLGIPRTGISPGDVSIAVGPNHIVQVVNTQIAVFSKTGTQLSTTPFSTFFAGSGFCVDPTVVYIPWDDRFVMVCSDLQVPVNVGTVRFAISHTNDPTGAWDKYSVGAKWLDQTNVTATSDKVVFGGYNTTTLNYQLYVYEKADLLSASATPRFTATTLTGQVHRAVVQTTQTAPAYFVNAYDSTSPITISRITGLPSTSNVTVTQATLTSRGFTSPPVPQVPGGTLSELDARPHNAQFAHVGSTDIIQFSQSIASGGQAATAVTKLNATSWPPTFTSQWIDGVTGTDNSWGASIMDGAGHSFIVYAASNANTPNSMYIVGDSTTQLARQAIQMGAGATTVCSTGSTPPCAQRWGDYLGVAQDPTNPSTVWFSGLYQSQSGGDGWGTTITSASAVPTSLVGTHSLAFTATAASWHTYSSRVAVTVGASYTASCSVLAATVGRSMKMFIEWDNGSNVFISESDSTAAADITTGWTAFSVTGTAPAGAVTARVGMWDYSGASTAGEIHYIDGVRLALAGLTGVTSSQFSVAQPVVTGGTAKGIVGMIHRQGFPPFSATDPYMNVLSGYVVNGAVTTDGVAWSELQPASFGPIVANNPIDTAIAAVRTQMAVSGQTRQWSLKLRIFTGENAPAWAQARGGGPIVGNQGGTNVTMGAWWTAEWLAAWKDLMTKLAAKYDSVPEIGEVVVAHAGTQGMETLLKNDYDSGSSPGNANALATGVFTSDWTWVLDKQNHQNAAAFMQSVWKTTPSSVAFNPAIVIGAAPRGAATPDEVFTESLMDYIHANVPTALGVLENNSLRANGTNNVSGLFESIDSKGNVTDGHGTQYSQMYTHMMALGPKAIGGIQPGGDYALIFTTDPNNVVTGTSIVPPVKVTIVDSANNPTGSSAVVTMAMGANPGSATLTGGGGVAAFNGVATFSSLSLNSVANNYSLTATSPGLISATSGFFNVTAAVAGEAELLMVTQPTNVAPNTNIFPSVQVKIADNTGVQVQTATDNVTVALGQNTTGATLSAAANPDDSPSGLVEAAVAGLATFDSLIIDKVGTYTLVFTSGTLTPVTSAPFQIQTSTGGGRDALLQPFTSTSIWNQPIGSNAVYVNPNLHPATIKTLITDQNVILMDPTQPPTKILFNGAGWSGSSRCPGTTVVTTVPMDNRLLVPNLTHNFGMAAILADGKTIVMGEPMCRCPSTPPTISHVGSANTDITGDGLIPLASGGWHGGSGLSILGGTIRLGELKRGGGIPHALAININATTDLYAGTVARTDGNGTTVPSGPGWRWPATKADGYVTTPGRYGGTNHAMQEGVLLALPPAFSISALKTVPGQMIATAFRNYGGYCVNDSTRAVNTICTELGPVNSVVNEFQTEWGYAFETADATNSTPWGQDIAAIYAALRVVDNNAPSSIGGGGTPLVPLSPAIGSGGGTPQAPPKPTGLASSNITSTSCTLTWTATTGATGYTPYQGGVALSVVNSPTAQITNLTPSTPYTFTVDAFNSAGHSNQSSPVSVTTAATGGGGGGGGIQLIDNMVIILMENRDFHDVMAANAAPYIAGLANQWAASQHYTGIGHPSAPNYLALTAGQVPAANASGGGNDSYNLYSINNLTTLLEGASISWGAYLESMVAGAPTTGTNLYAVRHNPFCYFNNVMSSPTLKAKMKPYTAFTPGTERFQWITPNLTNDMHTNTSTAAAITAGDKWCAANIPPILASPAFGAGKNSVLILVWDEGNGTQSIANQVVCIFAGSAVQKGKPTTAYNHYNLLATIEAAFGLGDLGQNDHGAAVMTDMLN